MMATQLRFSAGTVNTRRSSSLTDDGSGAASGRWLDTTTDLPSSRQMRQATHRAAAWLPLGRRRGTLALATPSRHEG